MKKTSAVLIALLMCMWLFSFAAFASQGQKLTVSYTDGGEYLQGADFSVYYLGSAKNGKIIPDDTFSSYSVSFDVSDSEKMMSLALTLSAYALRDDIVPDYSDTTDKNGLAAFGGAALPEGAYLIMAEKLYYNGNYYFCEPTIVILPYGEAESLIVTPKFEAVPEDTESLYVSYRVLKAWVEDEKGIRPVEIHVELLRDGEIYDTVVLNSENNWKYQWDGLSSHYHWTVTEKTVEGDYVVSLSQAEKAFLLTNNGGIGEKDTTTSSPIVETTSPDKTTTSPDKSDVPVTEPKEEEEIPVTGALRWPIPYLAMAGLLLFIIGYVKYRKSELKDE